MYPYFSRKKWQEQVVFFYESMAIYVLYGKIKWFIIEITQKNTKGVIDHGIY